jgi:PAS domain S-box-containing protein
MLDIAKNAFQEAADMNSDAEFTKLEKSLQEAHDRMSLMLDTSPLCAQIWARDLSTIDCNEAGVRLYGFKDKAEYTRRFLTECSPEFQPCGRRSDEKAVALVHQAFEEGCCIFEWTHRIPDRDLLFPAEVTLVRAKYKDQDVVIGYTRDLRKQVAAMEEKDNALKAMTHILNGIDALIYTTVPETCEILFINDHMKKHYGIENDVTGQKCYIVFQEGKDEKCEFCPCHQLDRDPDSVVEWEEHSPLTNRIYRNTDRYIKWYDGRTVHIQYGVDITDIVQAQEHLKTRDALLQAVNRAAALLLTTEENENIENPLIASMELIGRSIHADRVHLWRKEVVSGELKFMHTHEWLSETGRQKATVSANYMAPYKNMHIWKNKFLRNEVVGGRISALSPEEVEYFSAFDIKTVILIPLILGEEFWGLFSVDDCVRERDFTEDEISILRSVSLMLANAINRHSLTAILKESGERLMLMLDTSPLCAQIWARDLSTIDCNEAGVRLYEFKDKKEYTERFIAECSPEFQPCGRRSDEKAVALVHQAFEEGYCIFEWTHRIPDRDLLFPAEVTLVRAKYKDQDVVIGYTRDLRKHHEMMEAIKYRDRLMNAVNHAAALLQNSDLNVFETVLKQSMRIIAEAARFDCVYLWKNKTAGGKLFCFQLFEWSPQQTMFADGKLYRYDDVVPGWEAVLSDGKHINSIVRNMSREEQDHLTPSGILSILVIPIFKENQFWGFVGFDDCQEERIFSQEEEAILHSASLILANAFIRSEMILDMHIASELLKQHEMRLQAVNRASIMLLTTNEGEDIETPLVASMESIGKAMNADRLHIWQSTAEDGGYRHTCAYSWDSELAKKKRLVPKGSILMLKSSIGLDWDDAFLRSECVSGSLSTMSPNEQALLRSFDIVAIAIIPMFLDDQLWGILCVGDCKRERDLTEEEEAILRSVSLMMASAINRHALVEKRTRELALQSATLTTLLDSIPDMIFTKDKDLLFTHVNRALLSHFDRKIEDVIGYDDEIALGMPPEMDAKHAIENIKIMNKGEITTIEEVLPRYDGAGLLFETTKVPLAVGGQTVGILGIARNITERREQERITAFHFEYAKKLSDALANITKSPTISAGNLKAAADVISREGCLALNTHKIGIWKLTDGGNTLESISYYCAATDAHTVQDLYDLTSRQKYASFLRNERLVVFNDVETCKKVFDGFGTIEPAHLCAALDAPIRIDGELVGVVCVEQEACSAYPGVREWMIEEQNFASSLADLMALAMSGFERRKARDEAQTANQAKSDFLANMSHEIRTPMNVIVGLTELLIEGDVPAGEMKEYLQKINAAGSTLTGLINDVLDISKIEAGKFELSPIQYELASLLNDIVTLSIVRIDEKPIAFVLDAGEDLFANLYGDDLRVKQIFVNLLSNAFKYTQKGSVTLSVSCAREEDGGVRLSLAVSDTGIGMRPEDMDKLFTNYNQVDTHANRTIEGTGLGLSIVKGLTELMGGDITVKSEYGKGSVFCVSIRQGFVSDQCISKEMIGNLRGFRYEYSRRNSEKQIVRPDLSWAKVLVVDDAPTNLDVARGVLGKYKMKVDCVLSGQDAIDRIERGQPVYDAIFMDHMMPGMDGIEAAARIRLLGTGYAENIPLIALTANAIAGNEQMFLDKGFQAFLSKPINMAKLDAVVRQWIMGSEQFTVESGQLAPDSGQLSTLSSQPPTVDITGINAKLGLSLYDGDMEMYIDILRSYVENTPAEIDKLRGVSEDTLSLYAIDIHTMKGVNSTIGAKEMTKRAKKLESMAKEGDLASILELNEDFIRDAETLVADIAAWLVKNT